jgi:integrase
MSTTIGGLMREWQERRAPVMTARTVATNIAPVNVICSLYGNYTPKKFTSNDAEDLRNMLLQDHGLTKITVARYLSTLRAGCNGHLDHVDLGKLISELKREPPVVECWTKDEAREIIVETDNKEVSTGDGGIFFYFLSFLFGTGCRRGEALSLQLEDVDLPLKRLHIHRSLTLDGDLQNGTKWGGERWMPMPERLCTSFAIWFAARNQSPYINLKSYRGFVFPGLDQRTVGRRFNRVRDAAGARPFKMHCTRHSAISWALSAGMSLRKASEIFGVSQATLEKHYAHYVEEEVNMEWANL